MKSGQSSTTSTSWATHHPTVYKLRPIILPSPPVKLANGSSLKMKSRKRASPKQQQQQQAPLPSISTLFDNHSSCSLSSSSNSSYGSYCQFSPEGTYTMYNMSPTYSINNQPTKYDVSNVGTQIMTTEKPAMSAFEHKPVHQPLFVQTSGFGGYNQGLTSSYPTTSTINVGQLLLRPVQNN